MLSKTKIVETSLVLTTGFLGLYFILTNPVFLWVALAFGITGIFIPVIARYIAFGWFKLADVLNFVVSKIILGLVYFIILFPIAFIYKALGNDKLNLTKKGKTNWVLRNIKYQRTDIDNIW